MSWKNVFTIFVNWKYGMVWSKLDKIWSPRVVEADSQNFCICYTACVGRVWMKSQKSEKSNFQKLKNIIIWILLMSFLWFFTFYSDPASTCCVAYSQILGINLYFTTKIFSKNLKEIILEKFWKLNFSDFLLFIQILPQHAV